MCFVLFFFGFFFFFVFQSIAQDRVDRKCRVPDEPDATNADSIRVLIKLSNGKRLERRFLRSHPLQVRLIKDTNANAHPIVKEGGLRFDGASRDVYRIEHACNCLHF